MDAEHTPVIVGVGQVNDRPADPQDGLEPLDLMEAALRRADEDAGGGWLTRLDMLAIVDQISFREQGDLSRPLAARLAASPVICEKTPMPSGDSPILLLNEAANRIAEGRIRIAAVAGGEALRTAAQRAAAAHGNAVSDHNATRMASARMKPNFRRLYGLTAPVDVYPLYENAGRAAYGQSLDEAQEESAAIWSVFSKVADVNAGAWIHKPATPAQIRTPSVDNRLIAFPYTKLMVANSSVNQGAGFIVTSLAEATRRGVPEARLVYVGLGAAAHEPEDPLGRDRYDHSPSMAVSIRQCLALNGLATGDLDHVELYSCFPCVPKMARRVLGWPVDRPATVFGGLTFGGGPIGNYMSHAIVSMVLKLREQGRFGLLFANGGFATHNHTIIVGREPPAAVDFPQAFNVQAEADQARGPMPPVLEEYAGPATIETYTVLYERDGSAKWGVIVARTPQGARTLAKVPAADIAGIERLTNGKTEPVGCSGSIVPDTAGPQIWKF